jgi:G3E family GTPase
MTRDEPLDWSTFVTWIQTLINHRGEDILRIKGILNIEGEDKPIAVHGIQHMFHTPVKLPEWPGGDRRTKIVFITRDLDRKVIEDSLDALGKAAAPQEG